MGIKSTTELTRDKAESLYRYLKERIEEIRTPLNYMSDHQLEDELDDLQEELCKLEDRTCFDNYIIRD